MNKEILFPIGGQKKEWARKNPIWSIQKKHAKPIQAIDGWHYLARLPR